MILGFDKFAYKLKIKKYCFLLGIKDYKINKDNTIDVNESIYLTDSFTTNSAKYSWDEKKQKRWFRDKLPIKFGKVYGNFNISGCFLKTLEGCPSHVEGHFDCSNNKDLESLEGSPKFVGGNYNASSCNIKSLKGISNNIGKLYSKNNSGRNIALNLIFNENLMDLIDFPDFLKGNFSFRNCPVEEILDLLDIGYVYYGDGNFDIKNEKIIHLINEYDVIQGKNIIEDRLIDLYHTLDLEVPQSFNFKNYNLI
jgi:hypothetical protein